MQTEPELISYLTLQSAANLVLLMIGAAVVAGFLLLFPLWRFRGRLDALARNLQRTNVDPQKVRTALAPLFDRFLAAWDANAVEVDGTRVSTTRFEDFVEPVDAYKRLANVRFDLIRPTASILLALGILFTFLGLTLGIQGLETGTADALTLGINSLLGGMFLAFLTSITGIALSIIWIIASRWLLGRLDRSVSALALVVHRRLPWMAPQELHAHRAFEATQVGNALLRRQLEQEEEQATLLRTLAVDLAEAIGGKLQQSLHEEVVPVLEGMRSALTTFMEEQATAQEESLGALVSEFQAGLTEHLKEHVDGIAGTMAAAAENIERFHATLEPAIQRMADMAKAQANLVEQTTIASREFTESVSALADVNNEIQAAAVNYREASASAKEVVQAARGEAAALAEANGALRAELAEHLDQVSDQVRLLGEAGGRLESATGEMVPRLEAAVTEFTGLAADKLHEVFKVFDHEVAAVVDRLSGTLHAMDGTLEELVPMASGIGSGVNGLQPLVAQAESGVQQLLASLEESRAATQGLANSLAQAVEARDSGAASTRRGADTSERPALPAEPERVRFTRHEVKRHGEIGS